MSKWGAEDRTLGGPGMEEDALLSCAEEMQPDCGCSGGALSSHKRQYESGLEDDLGILEGRGQR